MIDEAVQNGSRLREACQLFGLSRRTQERWEKAPNGDMRKGPRTRPANKLTEDERNRVIGIVTSEKYRELPPSQIVPLLADDGKYVASESTFYRVLKEEKMDAHRSRAKPATKSKPNEHEAYAPNEVWSWDITYLKTTVAGMFFYLYLVMDVYSRKIVGFELMNHESSEIAAVMIDRICGEEKIDKEQLLLHSDNGGPMKGATMLATLQRLGVVTSFSRPSVSNDNAFSESLFRTMKYVPWYPSRPFATREEAILWVQGFITWYNTQHLHSGISFVTPESRHLGNDLEILEKRKMVYAQAKNKNPNRWSGETRNWEKIKVVVLNQLKKETGSATKEAA